MRRWILGDIGGGQARGGGSWVHCALPRRADLAKSSFDRDDPSRDAVGVADKDRAEELRRIVRRR